MSATRIACIATGIAFIAASARAGAPLPVQVLTAQQTAQLTGFTEVPLATAQFKSAAFVDVAAKPSLSQKQVEREAGATSAQYAGVRQHTYSIVPAPAPALTGAPPGSAHFAFKQSGDAAQGWATMTATGMPFIDLNSFGKATASGTASWTAHVTVPASDPNLYVQFRVPAALVTGATEQNGPSNWKSRFRAEILMNGHPVWNSEAARFSDLDQPAGGDDNCAAGNFEKSKSLVTFGRGLGFSKTNAEQLSAPQSVALSLGAFPAGQSVEVSMIVREDAEVQTQCCPHDMNGDPEEFCTRSTARLDWDGTADPVHFWVGPALASP